ncbi:hypothetical protein C0J52_26889, partial [Blattella germanica]
KETDTLLEQKRHVRHSASDVSVEAIRNIFLRSYWKSVPMKAHPIFVGISIVMMTVYGLMESTYLHYDVTALLCALMDDKISIPYFFEERTVMLNNYHAILQLYAVPLFKEGAIFQQYSTPLHYANIFSQVSRYISPEVHSKRWT